MSGPKRTALGRSSAFVSACALVAGSGCATSPKVEYFTLEPTATHEVKLIASEPVQVAQVHLPPTLDREQMVRYTGAYTLDISDQHRWSAPLDQMVRRVLTEDLMRILSPARVILPQEPAPAGTNRIVVDVVEFAPGASGAVKLDASWSLIPASAPDAPQSRYARFSEAADPNDASDQVSAMSRILDRLAVEMARSLAEAGPAPPAAATR